MQNNFYRPPSLFSYVLVPCTSQKVLWQPWQQLRRGSLRPLKLWSTKQWKLPNNQRNNFDTSPSLWIQRVIHTLNFIKYLLSPPCQKNSSYFCSFHDVCLQMGPRKPVQNRVFSARFNTQFFYQTGFVVLKWRALHNGQLLSKSYRAGGHFTFKLALYSLSLATMTVTN